MPCSTTCLYHPHPPWKFAWSFIWRNLNRLHPLMLCAKFGWLLATWLWILRWRCEQFTDRRSDVLTYKLRMTGIRRALLSYQLNLLKMFCFQTQEAVSPPIVDLKSSQDLGTTTWHMNNGIFAVLPNPLRQPPSIVLVRANGQWQGLCRPGIRNENERYHFDFFNHQSFEYLSL